jgi:hypothetical protein
VQHLEHDHQLRAAARAIRGQDLPNAPSRFAAILFSARRRAAGLVVLSPGLPTQQWTKWVKSKGRRNGFNLETNHPCRQNHCLTARGLPQYLCHFDASKVHLAGPDPLDAVYPSEEWTPVAFAEAEKFGTVHYRNAVAAAKEARAQLSGDPAQQMVLI